MGLHGLKNPQGCSSFFGFQGLFAGIRIGHFCRVFYLSRQVLVYLFLRILLLNRFLIVPLGHQFPNFIV